MEWHSIPHRGGTLWILMGSLRPTSKGPRRTKYAELIQRNDDHKTPTVRFLNGGYAGQIMSLDESRTIDELKLIVETMVRLDGGE